MDILLFLAFYNTPLIDHSLSGLDQCGLDRSSRFFTSQIMVDWKLDLDSGSTPKTFLDQLRCIEVMVSFKCAVYKHVSFIRRK